MLGWGLGLGSSFGGSEQFTQLLLLSWRKLGTVLSHQRLQRSNQPVSGSESVLSSVAHSLMSILRKSMTSASAPKAEYPVSVPRGGQRWGPKESQRATELEGVACSAPRHLRSLNIVCVLQTLIYFPPAPRACPGPLLQAGGPQAQASPRWL